jgi:phosphohistidine phosphatase
MKLLIIRHAKAEERSGRLFMRKKDADRRLTDEGRKDMRKHAKGLREIAPTIDVLATSPLVRARETAEIVAEVFGVSKIVELALLAPESDKQALLAWLKEQAADATIAIVGHEPHLSSFASLLIGEQERTVLTLKKGACCLIEFEDSPAAAAGVLLWLLQPGQLKKIDA